MCTFTYQFIPAAKVPQVRLGEQGEPVLGATLRSEHSPSDFCSIGAHGDRLSSTSRDLGDRGDRGSLGQKIHFTAYFHYELAF